MSEQVAENPNLPNTFQTPNYMIDRALPLLTDTEFKCLMVTTRHVLGWVDKIGCRQNRIGLKTYEKAGISRAAASTAMTSLTDFGFTFPIGKKNHPQGQMWKLTDGSTIQWAELEARQAEEDSENKGRVKAATAHSLRRRTQKRLAQCHELATCDVMSNWYVRRYEFMRPKSPIKSISNIGTGTCDVRVTGTCDVPKRQTQTLKPKKIKDFLSPADAAKAARAEKAEPLYDKPAAPLTDFQALKSAYLECYPEMAEAYSEVANIVHLLNGSSPAARKKKKNYVAWEETAWGRRQRAFREKPVRPAEMREFATWYRSQNSRHISNPESPATWEKWFSKFRNRSVPAAGPANGAHQLQGAAAPLPTEQPEWASDEEWAEHQEWLKAREAKAKADAEQRQAARRRRIA